jgi:hypothetical protein
VESKRLRAWLLTEGLTLHIGAHINADDLGVSVVHPFQFIPVSRLKEGIYDCQAFISDYSGLLADFLSFDRPTIFFPFDREDYLRVRRLYVTYDDFAYGPLVETADDLVELLVFNRWRDPAPHAARKNFWRREVFPTLEPVYAATNYLAMVALLAPRSAS